MWPPSIEIGARSTVFVTIGALAWWAIVRWVWPWCGPWLIEPCPLPTVMGCRAALIVGALIGFAKAVEFEIALARSQRAAGTSPRGRRISRPVPIVQPPPPPHGPTRGQR